MITIERAESNYVNPLVRFVTEDAIALLLNIPVTEIKEIRCWPNVILVIAEHLVRFVSYADLPPILEAAPPTNQDILTWRKRWRKQKTHKAPEFWKEFYSQKFRQANSSAQLYAWGRLINILKFAFSHERLESLRNVFRTCRTLLTSPVSHLKNSKILA
ncbi:hypothetical protein Cylst_4853 [Cylindrospermum stagnale PCC 7417]|uniref:Uncharacterized protein n=1 Tax=Cylindrospermum stagnale PCC 7417 TaxID=56107 RepID=K9X357_9NOST|nr:hypothetical protein [Cylindrospermum stagnale]AFZ26908.1 hypothetical protein Cylst_4853 [Cylindrospermum stagnale PCC 7417]